MFNLYIGEGLLSARGNSLAEKRSRSAARQLRDRWRMKTWFNLTAPDMFDRASLGETMSDEPGKLVGRRTIVSHQDLSGDYSKAHVKLTFEVYAVKGNDALTRFIGHDFRKTTSSVWPGGAGRRSTGSSTSRRRTATSSVSNPSRSPRRGSRRPRRRRSARSWARSWTSTPRR